MRLELLHSLIAIAETGTTSGAARLLAVARQTVWTTEGITHEFDRLPEGPARTGVHIGLGPTAGVLLGAPLAAAAILQPILPGSGAITDALAIVSEDIEALVALVTESDAVLVAARPMVTRLPGVHHLQSVTLEEPIAFSARVRMGVEPRCVVPAATRRRVSVAAEAALMALGADRVD